MKNQTLWLSHERCLFWEEEKVLILSDLHLGKSGHFRKSGIAIPQGVFKEDLQCLISQIQFFNPAQLLIVGDLFHSSSNKEHDLFIKWRNDFPQLVIHLVEGNHDILHQSFYKEAAIEVHSGEFAMGVFNFCHDISHCSLQNCGYTFSGHIHPGILLYGAGRQSLRFPCFYFGKEYAVLPAFGKFTGTYLIRPEEDEQVFAILPSEKKGVPGSIMQLQ
ncbi:MAG: ligase-associated DNA damage response endonuclease PdeM [Ferruginibacter sp.]